MIMIVDIKQEEDGESTTVTVIEGDDSVSEYPILLGRNVMVSNSQQVMAGELLEFEYSNSSASYLGQTLTAGGEVISFQGNKIALDLAIMNGDGEITTPGSAVISIG